MGASERRWLHSDRETFVESNNMLLMVAAMHAQSDVLAYTASCAIAASSDLQPSGPGKKNIPSEKLSLPIVKGV